MSRKTKADPTGQRHNRKMASASIRKRLAQAKKEILAEFKAIPYTKTTEKPIVNLVREGKAVFQYEYSETQLMSLYQRFLNVIQEKLGISGDQTPPEWFYKEHIEKPYRESSFEDINDINRLIAEAQRKGWVEEGFIERELNALQYSQSGVYIENLNAEFMRSYLKVKTLSEDTARDVYETVWDSIHAGKTQLEIGAQIVDRFGVAESNAKRIATTSVNEAHNNAKLSLSEILSEEMGVEVGNMHISALMPTTRRTHAARHGLIFTVKDQLEWWDSGSNRISCLCTVKKMIINPKTGRAYNKKLQNKTREEGKSYFEEVSNA